MTVTLPPHLDRFLQTEVAAGRYPSFADAVCDAVERLRRVRHLENLRQKIDQGLASIERGDVTVIESEEDEERFFGELMAGLPEGDAAE
jgi:putative addiction module CopG family antidote